MENSEREKSDVCSINWQNGDVEKMKSEKSPTTFFNQKIDRKVTKNVWFSYWENGCKVVNYN